MNLIEKVKLGLLLNKINKQAMWEKLSSRKLWVVVITATVTSLGSQLDIDPEAVQNLINLAMVYVGGQGVVDAAGALSKGKGK